MSLPSIEFFLDLSFGLDYGFALEELGYSPYTLKIIPVAGLNFTGIGGEEEKKRNFITKFFQNNFYDVDSTTIRLVQVSVKKLNKSKKFNLEFISKLTEQNIDSKEVAKTSPFYAPAPIYSIIIVDFTMLGAPEEEINGYSEAWVENEALKIDLQSEGITIPIEIIGSKDVQKLFDPMSLV